MTSLRKVLGAALPASLLLFTGATLPASAQIRDVPPATRISSDLGPVDAAQSINITVHLKSPKDALFKKTVDALYDPSSPTYHHWLTNDDLKQFAPPQEQLDAVKKELENQGLTILSTDVNGFSVRARGTTEVVGRAFNTPIHSFQHNGKIFRANTAAAHLSGVADSYVAAVAGIESHTIRPHIARAMDLRTKQAIPSVLLSKVQAASNGLGSVITSQILSKATTVTLDTPGASLPVGVYYGNIYGAVPNLTPDYTPAQLQKIYGLSDAYSQGLNGKGETIVLLEAYGYPTIQADANAFSKLMFLSQLTASNFQIVYPEGQPTSPDAGILTGWDGEIALDVQWAHAIAPGAKIVVVAAAGEDSEDFQDAISYITDHNLGNSVSDSWGEDLDIIAGPVEQQAFDLVLQRAAAKGISFQFSTGDDGDNGLGTPVGAASVPANSPHATAVGGTSILTGLSSSGTTTVGWGNDITILGLGGPLDPPDGLGLYGGSGGGESLYFAKPSWQKSLPGTGRQTPDVSALADPYTGVPIVLTSQGQQYLNSGVGGTSLASPIFTAIWAIANQKAGHSLGLAAPTIAALPKGSLLDVVPVSSPTNVSGVIYDASGASYYSASALFSGALDTTTSFISAIANFDDLEYIDISFGTDSSLTTTPGWDNVTGFGTPNGLAFINAAAQQ